MRPSHLLFPALLTACTQAPGGDDSAPTPEGSQWVEINSERHAYLCLPQGSGPFPVAIYNHGGLGDAVGGDPEGTCLALAEFGYLGLSPLRRETVPVDGHSEDVEAGINYALSHPMADSDQVAILGFSRGGYLSFKALTAHPEIDLAVIMAPAPVNGLLEEALPDAHQIEASTLVLVAENDLPEFNNEGQDHVASATAVHDAIKAAGGQSELEVLDAFEDNGHDLFQEVRDEYWSLVAEFL
jgi:dienelactone hydrolase